MDETYIKLLELVRAGWTLTIGPETVALTLGVTRAEIIWSRRPSEAEIREERLPLPRVDWLNPFAPTDVQRAIAIQHALVFPIPPLGELPTLIG